MNYQVLARKWRPQKFSELVGQEHVVKAISNALDNNKLHHAYLFTGTRGVGKTTIARIFSKSLNCETGQSANPCGTCNACMDIDEGRYVDLLEIDAASRTKVEDTRELLDNVQYKPTRGRFKVYLIDEVHMLSKHSFNALLKTLEEPPSHVKFLLATTDPQKLPITILSRCLQFSLKALSREQIQSQLSFVLEQEKIDSDTSALSHLARAAMGSMRDALSLTDQAIAQGNNHVDEQTVISMLGLLDKNQVLKLAKAIIEKDANAAMQQLDDIAQKAPDYSQVISELQALFHQISLTQIVPDVCKIETLSARAVFTLAKAVTPEHVQLLYQIALQGKRDLAFAPDPMTGLQMTIMRLLAFSPASQIEGDLQDLHQQSLDEHQKSMNTAHASDSQETFKPESFTQEAAKSESVVQESLGQESQEPDSLTQSSPAIEADISQEVIEPEGKLETKPSDGFDEQMLSLSQYDEDLETANNLSSLNQEMSALEQQSSDQFEQANQLSNPSGQDSFTQVADGLQESVDDASIETTMALLDLQDELDTVVPIESEEVQTEQPSDVLDKFMSDSIVAKVVSSEEAIELASEDDESTFAFVNNEGKPQGEANETPVELDAGEHSTPENLEISTEAIEASDQKENISAPAIPNIEVKPANLELNPYLDNGDKLTRAYQIDEWSKLIEALAELSVKGLNKQLLLKSNLIKNGDQVAIKLCETEQHLNEASSVNSIKQAFSEYYGKDVELDLQVGKVVSTPEQIQKAIDDMRQEYAYKVIETDETIQEIIKAFDARVVSGTIVPT